MKLRGVLEVSVIKKHCEWKFCSPSKTIVETKRKLQFPRFESGNWIPCLIKDAIASRANIPTEDVERSLLARPNCGSLFLLGTTPVQQVTGSTLLLQHHMSMHIVCCLAVKWNAEK